MTKRPPEKGPTGKLHPTGRRGQSASEMSITVTDPRLNSGRPTNIPSIVPGQIGLDALLVTGRPTRAQEARAVEYQLSRKRKPPAFRTITEAVKAAETRTTMKSFQGQRRAKRKP